jgi:hypothetical protein
LKVKKIVKKLGTVKRKAEVEEDRPSLSLPTERTEPCGSLEDYSILLYGAKKIGKTTLSSMFDKAFFMLCEPGGKALSIFSRNVRSWLEFKGYVNLLLKDKKFANVIVDTADYMYEMCMDYVCKKMVIDHPSDEAWGKGWKAVKKELNTEITKLLQSGKGVILISHAREEEIKKRGGDTFNRTSSTLSGQAKELLEGVVDIWGYYTYEGNQRVLYVNGDDYIDAGHRLEGRFLYPDGTPIRKIPMGKSKEEAYKNFVLAFENKLPKLATPAKKKLVLKRS